MSWRFIPARAGNTRDAHHGQAWASVHPRSRGEHWATGNAVTLPIGSSPLARGTPQHVPVLGEKHRFIPARAGNTHSPARRRCGPPVHPRSRGEHNIIRPSSGTGHGSSPLARGTHDGQIIGQHFQRFIPARAGNTTRADIRASTPAVHPRSRGEHGRPFVFSIVRAGSSPLARGTHHAVGAGRYRRRFIPARAGNTSRCRCRPLSATVHPRSRGEHRNYVRQMKRPNGSSPLARGTRHTLVRPLQPVRFIPARAGNTRRGPSPARRAPVHPRSRGEHESGVRSIVASIGSSPLARGTLRLRARRPPLAWFIPARAGNTISRPPITWTSSVHPRSRGEHRSRSGPRAQDSGSSPLARGTPPRPERVARLLRFIPARAGNTGPGRYGMALRRFIPARAGNTARAPRAPRARPVHPRSRGEHPRASSGARSMAGSSPLARGTLRRTPRTAIAAVHPRSRGEHPGSAAYHVSPTGSSPLARGTPARASGAPPPPSVHPRSRGEHTSQNSLID